MKIQRGIVRSKILECSEKEEDLLNNYFNDFECGSSLLEDQSDIFYSGLVPWLQRLGITFDFEEDDQPPNLPVTDVVISDSLLKGAKLRDYQTSALRKALHYSRGIIQSPTGSGKTVVAAAVYAHLNCYGIAQKLVYLTPTVFLMEQTANKLEMFGFGSVCRVGGGYKFKAGYDIYVFVVDSAYRGLQKPDVYEAIRNAHVLILDEAHHASAKSWTQVCEACQAPYRYAFTATVHDDPEKYSYIDLVLIGLIGPILFEVRSKELRERGFLADPLVTMVKTNSPKIRLWDWDSVYVAGIVQNKMRNNIIMSVAGGCYESGNKVMVFIGRKKHGHRLAQGISSQIGKEVCFVHGNNTSYLYKPSGNVSRNRWSVEQVATYINEREQSVLITTTVLDEGLDVPVINVLIMATAMKKYRRTVQRCGRGMRPKEGSNRVYIFDFWDNNHPYLEKHSKYRLWTYQEEVFDISPSLEETQTMMGSRILIDNQVI